jgi:hypothetical protein
VVDGFEFRLPVFDRGGAAGDVVAADSEVPAAAVHFDVPSATAVEIVGDLGADDHVNASAGRTRFGVGSEASDVARDQRVERARQPVAALVEVDAGVRVVGGEHEPDAVRP